MIREYASEICEVRILILPAIEVNQGSDETLVGNCKILCLKKLERVDSHET